MASTSMSQLKSLAVDEDPAWKLEEAKVLWHQGENEKALRSLKAVLKTINKKCKYFFPPKKNYGEFVNFFS